MRRGFLAVTIAVLLGGAGAASAQIYAPASLDRYFRLEWQATHGVKGPAIEGYVYNQGAYLLPSLGARGGVLPGPGALVRLDRPRQRVSSS